MAVSSLPLFGGLAPVRGSGWTSLPSYLSGGSERSTATGDRRSAMPRELSLPFSRERLP
jgi:hypothetical protein